VTESVSPAQQFGEHVLILRWFGQEYPSGVCRLCSSVAPAHMFDDQSLHLRTYGLLLSSLLYSTLNESRWW
jgi:hypothetical protein